MYRYLLGLIAGFVLLTTARADTWKAGFAKVAITPKALMWMSGYGARTAPAEGKETELWAKAMVLHDAAGATSVLVTLDLVGIDRTLSQAICKGIQEKYKLPREAVVLSASHTHCGPVVGTNLRSMYFYDDAQDVLVAEYTKALPGILLTLVESATAKLTPATVAWGTGQANFAVNRRENKELDVPALREKGPLKGPVDHDVPVLAVRDAKGALQGVVFGYACHATTLSFQKWCGDYPGFAMQGIEDANPGTVAMFFAGCGADQNPIPRRTVAQAKQYGNELAVAVGKVLAVPMASLKPILHRQYEEIALPLHAIPSREQLVKDSIAADKYIASRGKMLLKALENEGELPKTYPYPVQSWKLGGELNAIVLGGEVVVDFSLRFKKELPGGKTWVMGYANDVMAYIPSARVLKEGGYEGATSMIYYGMPSVWASTVEEQIVAEVHRQAKRAK